MLEREFQSKLVKEIRSRFRGCIVFKTDALQVQGFPDLLILHRNKWATLECKCSKTAHRQPNQDYWVNVTNELSFSRFIYPENKEAILDEMGRFFETD